jgi:protein-tyrosine-phosphatase
MLPLAYGIGSGAQMLQPLAIAVMGALAISVLLSLVATPVLYFLLMRCFGGRDPVRTSLAASTAARMHGAGSVEAYSAGSRPSGRVNPKPVETMREVGYDLTQHRSKSLSDIPAIEYDAVIGMGCGDEGCPLVQAKRREESDISDPKELPPERFREVRDVIEKKVKELMRSL